MADSDRKDTFGYLGHENMSAKELLGCLAAALEHMAKSESSDAVELARSKAREVVSQLEPLIAQSATARSNLEEAVRRQPLLAIALAGAAGFLMASLRRR
jgi:ElaB/YqjD/DUF883 family membrane-anchored ribosome-binding protein